MKKIVDKDEIIQECAKLASLIEQNSANLRRLLITIESYETIEDELSKSIETLKNIESEGIHGFINCGNGAAFFPVNLPLYSLVIFGIVPSIFAEKLFIRPPTIMQDIIPQIYNILPKTILTEKIIICNNNRTTFVEEYVAKSKFILFTGTFKNANIIRQKLRKDQLFIFNGQGINPVVIGPDANLSLAIKKTVAVKSFNSGQDCAAPDAIFIHSSIYEKFKAELIKALSKLHVGSYKTGAIIGPLIEPKQVLEAVEHLSLRHNTIIYGGKIDIKESIVIPTIIEYSSPNTANFKELFSPIWHICEYKNDDDLKKYFENSSYREYAMYVSLFGSSAYLTSQNHTIVLNNQIIIDVERGNKEYGGYCTGASFVQYQGVKTSTPILISREIMRALG